MSTGVPATLTLDPASVRQRDKDTTPVAATVTLESPSPSFFVCELRSAEPRKISFPTIIFRKGDLTGHAEGFVYWKAIRKESRVRVNTFSTDAPDRQLSFTVVLRPKTAEETEPPAGDAAAQ